MAEQERMVPNYRVENTLSEARPHARRMKAGQVRSAPPIPCRWNSRPAYEGGELRAAVWVSCSIEIFEEKIRVLHYALEDDNHPRFLRLPLQYQPGWGQGLIQTVFANLPRMCVNCDLYRASEEGDAANLYA